MIQIRDVLLVDDSPNDTELILEVLKEHNLANEVIVLNDGAEAVEYLFRRGKYRSRSGPDPAVVLLDIKLPKLSGLEVLARIRADAATRSLPVIMLTSSNEESDRLKSHELGVEAYVVKPVIFQEFVEAVRDLGAFWAIVNDALNPRGSSAGAA
jgi:CheY-like chemotaxis protein